MQRYWQIIKSVGLGGAIKLAIRELDYLARRLLLDSYSQNYEDKIIDKYLNLKNGFYLDIGANDPVRLSNTYRFYKKGWRGAIVEPNPCYKNAYANKRPKDIFFNVGIGNKKEKLIFYDFVIPALSTFLRSSAVENLRKGYKLNKKIQLEVISVSQLQKKIGNKIDFLSIDTEGLDLKILKGWDWQKHTPIVICVESKQAGDFLIAQKYMLLKRTKDNFIFGLK